jgi:hypothetical protein
MSSATFSGFAVDISHVTDGQRTRRIVRVSHAVLTTGVAAPPHCFSTRHERSEQQVVLCDVDRTWAANETVQVLVITRRGFVLRRLGTAGKWLAARSPWSLFGLNG